MDNPAIKSPNLNPTQPSQRHVKIRLGVMMTFLIIPVSCWWVTVASYIEQNTGASGNGMFSDGFIGKAYSTSAFAAFISPLFWGAVADRYISAERIMAALQVFAAFVLWQITRATTEDAWWWLMLCYFFCFSPQMGLANAVCFRHLKDPERTFPPIRAILTVSWVLGGWFVGYAVPLWFGHSIEATMWPLQFAIAFHGLAAVACLAVPPTPPLPGVARDSQPVRGLKSFRFKSLRAVFGAELAIPVISVTLLAVSAQFYMILAHVFLSDHGVDAAVGHLSWGQVTEIGCVLLFPMALSRMGFKWLLVLGSFCWCLRFLLLGFADGALLWLYWPSILLHGVCFSFTYLAIQIYAERVSPPESRASIQGLIVVLTSGVGALAGARLTSVVQVEFMPSGQAYDWRGVWFTAAALAAVPTLLLLFVRPVKQAVR